MNSNLIIGVLAIYGVFAAAGSTALYLAVSARIRMRRQQKRHLDESQSLREAIASLNELVAKLEVKVQKVGMDVKREVRPPAGYTPFTGFDALKRTEALRMYRRGSDRHTVSTALGLTSADVALLEKVHLLSDRAV
jgi:predicted transcriptional regulator